MIRRTLLCLLLICCCIIAAPLTLSAQASAPPPNPSNILSPACGTSGTSSSAVCTDVKNASGHKTADPVTHSLEIIVNIVALVAGAAAVLLILVGSIKYITSAGDSAKVSSAKNTIIYALIGIVVIVAAKTILIYVVNKINI